MYKYAITAILFGLMLAASTAYFVWSQREIRTLAAANATLAAEKATLQASNDQLVARTKEVAELTAQVDAQLAELRRENAEFVKKLTRHDIGADAAKKPKLVEDAINKSTLQFFDDTQRLSK